MRERKESSVNLQVARIPISSHGTKASYASATLKQYEKTTSQLHWEDLGTAGDEDTTR